MRVVTNDFKGITLLFRRTMGDDKESIVRYPRFNGRSETYELTGNIEHAIRWTSLVDLTEAFVTWEEFREFMETDVVNKKYTVELITITTTTTYESASK